MAPPSASSPSPIGAAPDCGTSPAAPDVHRDGSGSEGGGAERRRAPRRRLRDRIASLDTTQNPSLRRTYELHNLVLLAEDDLRQTALALGDVERYVTGSMALLESPDLAAHALAEHAADDAVLGDLESLAENIASLRRRMGMIAAAMKGR